MSNPLVNTDIEVTPQHTQELLRSGEVPKGFDPTEIRLVGQVSGEPPFKGQLRHHGWRVSEVKLPSLADGVDLGTLYELAESLARQGVR